VRYWLIATLMLAAGLPAAANAKTAAATIGFGGARHLLARTSFAAPVSEVDNFSRLTREQASSKLLSWSQTARALSSHAPSWVNEPVIAPRRLREMSTEERQAMQRMFNQRGMEMRVWWMQEMLTTPSPLTEKMVLFWHNHFVSSTQKVRQPQYMYRQHMLLRRHALGNFGEMLHEIARDPAMVVYLDSASNRKGRPNENFARELMELFTLGEGHYTESDVKEAARAFTGWSIDPERGEFLFRAAVHDDGTKAVLGKAGNLDGAAVLDILLAHPRTAEFIVAKLWREFVSPNPDPAEVRRIGAIFRDSRYDIRSALRAMLNSDAFYDTRNHASLIKSPVDLVVGTLRQFQFTTGDVQPLVVTVAQLGQNLFAPPNVKGWPGGELWINSTTLLARKQFLDRIFRADEARPAMMLVAANTSKGGAAAEARQRFMRGMAEISFDSDRWLRESVRTDSGAVARLVLAAPPHNAMPGDATGMELIRRMTQDPAYQLK
jgi:uncharacterized protein (DUF1800 family)